MRLLISNQVDMPLGNLKSALFAALYFPMLDKPGSKQCVWLCKQNLDSHVSPVHWHAQACTCHFKVVHVSLDVTCSFWCFSFPQSSIVNVQKARSRMCTCIYSIYIYIHKYLNTDTYTHWNTHTHIHAHMQQNTRKY